MLERLNGKLPLIAIAGIGALSLGMGAAVWIRQSAPEASLGTTESAQPEVASPHPGGDSREADISLQLALLPPEERAVQLAQLADDADALRSYRARYLLAVDLINQGRGGGAIPLLQGLEEKYPVLAPYVLLRRGQAEQATGQTEQAIATWKQVLERHGTDPAAAEALFLLGAKDPAYQDQLLKTFPAHPRSIDLALQRLADDPNRSDTLPLLLLVARHGIYRPESEAVLDRLGTEFAPQLTPADWQTIGFGYWEQGRYKLAGPAYAKAEPSPRNLYRAGRGHQIGGQRTAAIAHYTRLDQAHPTAPETATGLLKLSDMVPLEQALGVLDQVIARFPDYAAEAMLKRVTVLEELNSAASAQQTRSTILTQHSSSTAAAELRWQYAQGAEDQGDLATALRWGQELLQQNPESEIAPDVGFWSGKWARTLGQADVAQGLFEQVITHYPESYYAWRSAVALGWNVGDFKTVRYKIPAVELPPQHSPLPTGSETLTELYLLGQHQSAWERWQVEFTNLQTPTVAEQFTDGLMRLGVGDNLDGIYMVSSLSWRDLPEDKAAYQALKQNPDYWKALYPFPFANLIQTWAQQRQLNPLLVTALIRQESRFEPTIRSAVGAAGLMQVMPSTADWIQSQTGIASYDLDHPNDNINLGTWYLDYTHREYDNHSLFAVASYNAGPGNVAEWISEGNFSDADEFVEKIPFPETKGYVQAVFGGYWNYLRLYNPEVARQVNEQATRQSRQSGQPPQKWLPQLTSKPSPKQADELSHLSRMALLPPISDSPVSH